jgi:hypothetical protein
VLFSTSNTTPDNTAKSTNYAKGIYADTLIHGIKALVSYANLLAFDVNHFNKLQPGDTFTIRGIEKLVSEISEEIQQIRESGQYGMADESQLLSDFGLTSGSLVDRKKLMVPSIHYHKSIVEVSNFLENYWSGKTYNKANLSLEFNQQAEKLLLFKNISESTLAKINFSEEQLQLIKNAQLEQMIKSHLEKFRISTVAEKLRILYEVVCLSQKTSEISDLFSYLFKDFMSDNESLDYIENLAKIGSHSFLPLDKKLEKTILVVLEAYSQNLINLKTETKFSNFLRGISSI